jgi:hypothetical protein
MPCNFCCSTNWIGNRVHHLKPIRASYGNCRRLSFSNETIDYSFSSNTGPSVDFLSGLSYRCYKHNCSSGHGCFGIEEQACFIRFAVHINLDPPYYLYCIPSQEQHRGFILDHHLERMLFSRPLSRSYSEHDCRFYGGQVGRW